MGDIGEKLTGSLSIGSVSGIGGECPESFEATFEMTIVDSAIFSD